MPEANGNGIKYKLTVENRITAVETVLDEIRTNHLPHIEKKIDRITLLFITTLIALVTNLVLKLV